MVPVKPIFWKRFPCSPRAGLRSAQLDDMAAGADAGWTVLADITTATAPMRVGVGFANGGTGRDLRVDGAPARGFEKYPWRCRNYG